ncbi:hypothetical protein Peur_066020 [Populus x canadensis]
MESYNMVTVLQRCQVSPPPGTTSEKSLPLTFFDLRMVDSSVKLLFFFECTSISKNHFLESIIPSLKQSLSLSLKYYYPFAGNLIFPPNSGKPEIRYLERDSASLIFAESSSDFIHLTGKQTRDTTEFLSFLPQLPPESMSHDTLVVPISSFQVTLFPDSGICVGLHLRHAIGDGSSVVKSFLKTWASITKAGGDATFLSACAKTAQLKGSDGFVIGAKSIGDAIHKSLHHTGGVLKTVKNLGLQWAAASKGWLLESFSSPKFKMYDIDFGWGRLKTNEDLSIDDCEAIAVGDGQNEGETEIIVSNPKPIMDAFVSIFSFGLQTLDEEVKKLGANDFIRSKI